MTELTRRRSRRWTVGLAFAVVALALWGAAVATAAVGARADLGSAEEELQGARSAVTDLDIEQADAALARAEEHLAGARRRLQRPDVGLAARLPVVGDDLRTARAIAEGAELVAGAGRAVTGAILDLPHGSESLLPRDGRLPAGEFARLAEPVQAAAGDIVRARELVAASPRDDLVRQVATARGDFLELVEPVAETIDDLAALLRALPDLLGADGPRRYFLAAANPAEQRGSVGFLGSYAIATFDEGRLSIGPFRDINDLEDVAVDDLDTAPLAARYDPFGGSGTWKNLNMTPDFPSAARAIESLWEHVHDEALDGTIVVDPFALAALVELSGPVELPDGTTLAGTEVVDYVTNEAYADFDEGDERKGVLGDVAGAALLGFLEGASEDSARASITTLAELVAGRHLLVHSRHDEVQEGLAAVGAHGALPDPPGDFLAAVANSASNAKVDYYTERHLDYRVELLADGRARGELEVTFENEAPASGRPQHVLGPNVDRLDVGENRFFLSTYCATTCDIEAADGSLTVATLEEELGHPVASTWVELRRGAAATIGYRWVVGEAWEDTRGRLVYRLTVRHQVTVRPTTLRVQVAIPDGFEPVDLPAGLTVEDGIVVHETEAVGGDTTVTVELVPR